MDSLIAPYQKRLNLQNATFSRIDHEDGTVAIVYKIAQPAGEELILKVCARPNDYLREVYFLKLLAGKLAVPCIIQAMQPEEGIHGAILMERLPGALLKATDFTDSLAYEIGSHLARVHLNRAAGYGDLIHSQSLSPDPRVPFTQKFEEGFEECNQNLPKALLEQCRRYYDSHIDLLASVDGPCITHRDFRPGNVMVHEGKLQGIIDWAAGRASFAEEDLCPLGHGEWPDRPIGKRSFLKGYASIRPVPDYTAVMPLLRLSRAFAVIGFMVKSGLWESTHARIYQFNRHFLESLFKKP